MLGVLTDPVMILHAIRNQLVPDSWQRGGSKNLYPSLISFLPLNWYTFRGKQLSHFDFCLFSGGINSLISFLPLNWYTFRGKQLSHFDFCLFSGGINSWSKEFAPVGANSFLQELTLFQKGFITQGSKQEVTKLFPFEIMRKYGDVPIHFNAQASCLTYRF